MGHPAERSTQKWSKVHGSIPTTTNVQRLSSSNSGFHKTVLDSYTHLLHLVNMELLISCALGGRHVTLCSQDDEGSDLRSFTDRIFRLAGVSQSVSQARLNDDELR